MTRLSTQDLREYFDDRNGCLIWQRAKAARPQEN